MESRLMLSLKAVIFDLDETLIHSKIDFKKMKLRIITFLQCVGVRRGLLDDKMLNVEIINAATENLRRKGFSEEEIQRVLAKAEKIMNQVELESVDGAITIDGVSETLEALKTKGVMIGVMTNSCREYTEKVLTKFGLMQQVDVIVARDDVNQPKPSPEHAFHMLRLLGVSADDAVLVGDHWLDAKCAKESGLKFILVRRQGLNSALKEYSYQTVKSIREIVNVVR